MSKQPLVHLRALEPEDLELLYRWENDRSLWLEGSIVQPWSRELLRQYVTSVQDIFTHKQLRLVATTGEGKAIGLFDLFDFDPVHSRAGVGVLIGEPAFRGQGWGTQMLEAGLTYVRNALNLRLLHCQITAHNAASIRLFTAAGFEEVGRHPAWLLGPDGPLDTVLYQKILGR